MRSPADLRFNALDHTYWIGKRQIRSVSRILEAGGIKEPFFGRRGTALALGTEVHRLTELLDQGKADDFDFDPRVEAYRKCWTSFRETFPFDVLECEQPRYEAIYDYAGTPDRVVIWKKARTLLEIKTGAVYTWHPSQTAAYQRIVQAKRRIIVYLDPELPLGWKMEEHKDPRDWQRFAAALVTTQGMLLEGSAA